MALSDNAIREINAYVNEQGIEWAKGFIEYRKSWLDKKGIKASGELITSLEQEVTAQLQEAALVRIEIAFKDYGRYIDMKGLKPPKGGADYISGLEAWIEDKGLTQKFTRKFMEKRRLRQVPPNILNQLAWSVAISRTERVKRRRHWYNKPKSASITDLYNQVAAGLPEKVAQEIKNAFKQ